MPDETVDPFAELVARAPKHSHEIEFSEPEPHEPSSSLPAQVVDVDALIRRRLPGLGDEDGDGVVPWR